MGAGHAGELLAGADHLPHDPWLYRVADHFYYQWEPLARQWYRHVRQLFLARFNV